MNIKQIYLKLKKHNRRHYSMLSLCILISTLLVSSYGIMITSPTVTSVLPPNGNSRSQAFFIFGAAVIGCLFFTIYASSLFFKYKSKEFGVLLALGAVHSQIKKILLRELLSISALYSLGGVVLSIPFSYGMWMLVQVCFFRRSSLPYSVGLHGLFFGLLFSCISFLLLFINSRRFISNIDIIDSIKKQTQREITSQPNKFKGIVGTIFILLGLFLGYVVPHIAAVKYLFFFPSIWNLTYLFSAIGVYMLISHLVIYHGKSKKVETYYKNLVPKSMMKFSGKQTVRTMFVTTLLLSGALFAAFYVPTFVPKMLMDIESTPVDYTFSYNLDYVPITQEEINSLAEDNSVQIETYNTIDSLVLITNGFNYKRKNKNSLERIPDKLNESSLFFRASDFSKISGQNINLSSGEYLSLVDREYSDSIWSRIDDLSTITAYDEKNSIDVSFKGKVSFLPLLRDWSRCYIISDTDYAFFKSLSNNSNTERFILFNVENSKETTAFSKLLKEKIIEGTPETSFVHASYDSFQEKEALSQGKNYYSSDLLDPVEDFSSLCSDWKYYPKFKPLLLDDKLNSIIIFFMVFLYISIICFISLGIIIYTRSTTIAYNNKSFFQNLEKLGAKKNFIENCVSFQLKKLFIFPTAVGSIMILAFYGLIQYLNSNSFTQTELLGLCLNILLTILCSFAMYVFYRICSKNFHKIIS